MGTNPVAFTQTLTACSRFTARVFHYLTSFEFWISLDIVINVLEKFNRPSVDRLFLIFLDGFECIKLIFFFLGSFCVFKHNSALNLFSFLFVPSLNFLLQKFCIHKSWYFWMEKFILFLIKPQLVNLINQKNISLCYCGSRSQKFNCLGVWKNIFQCQSWLFVAIFDQ